MWIAALAGTMGPRTARGFQLLNAGLQVFERKPKAPAEAAPPVEAEPTPAAVAPEVAESAPPAVTTISPDTAIPTAADLDVPGLQIGKPKLSLKSRAKAG